MDLVLPDGSGAAAGRAILAEHPHIKVLFLSARGDDDALLEALEAGASGYISKAAGGAIVIDGIRRVATGESLIEPEILTDLRARIGQRDGGPVTETLTRRELEVLLLMSRGLGNKAIAVELRIGVSTVRGHVQNILEKMDVHSKLEAVARAKELGLLDRSTT